MGKKTQKGLLEKKNKQFIVMGFPTFNVDA